MPFYNKGKDFFEIFDQVGKNLVQASRELVVFFEDFSEMTSRVKIISDLEHDNDLLTQEIIRKLNRTFLTPIDREDIYALASGMDDILDLMWGAAQRSQLFKIKESTNEAAALAKTLLSGTEVIYRALGLLRTKKYSHILDLCTDIHVLENRNDKIFRETLGKMFETVSDPILIIKWKEVYEILENATDACEDVANILETVVLKYG
jgi:predicted phosphate transport protein (TIGR00153 family)